MYSLEEDTMTVKIKVYESMDSYTECIINMVELVLDKYSRELNPEIYKRKPVQEPEILDSNQFQLLHLYALFGLNENK